MLLKTIIFSAVATFSTFATASTCLYTKTCYGIAYGSGYVCGQEYPDGGRATGKKKACDGFALYAHECCGITKSVSNECQWSYCAGATIGGQTTCDDNFGADWKYTGQYSGANCAFTKSQTALISAFVSVVTASTCRWTPICFGTAYGDSYACRQEFPHGGKPSGKSESCASGFGKVYECCGITKIVTKECKWSYCAGLTVKGQTTCDDNFGSAYRYNGKTDSSGCGWSFNEKVECCKDVEQTF
ncbi:hypothetical protein MBANPS3_007982 [Mucor bainieri]